MKTINDDAVTIFELQSRVRQNGYSLYVEWRYTPYTAQVSSADGHEFTRSGNHISRLEAALEALRNFKNELIGVELIEL